VVSGKFLFRHCETAYFLSKQPSTKDELSEANLFIYTLYEVLLLQKKKLASSFLIAMTEWKIGMTGREAVGSWLLALNF